MDLPDGTDAAVSVRNVFKRYSKKSPYILKGLNLTVRKNNIYALLGASGCGKTTLLSCMVGRHLVDYGQIRMFITNKKQLGHMPQQVALYTEFSIAEVVRYFGYLYGMEAEDIKEKYDRLSKLLNLPDSDNRLCGALSGGQQRRVSLAITLIHDPALLILDEPTAGTDPVLSALIWDHLVELTRRGKTVIITTHYIEEARQSHMIGLMRKGVLLEESDPQSLLVRYNCSGLEEAFLYLCSRQSNQKKETQQQEHEAPSLMVQYGPIINSPLVTNEFIGWNRFKAQLMKQFIWIKRNILVMAYVVLLPLVSMVAFNCAIGLFPDALNVALINGETIGNGSCPPALETGCVIHSPLSCRYLDMVAKIGKINMVPYNNTEQALEAVAHSHTWGIIEFKPNFTASFLKRLEYGRDTDAWDLFHADVFIRLDMTDFVTSFYLQYSLLYESFHRFYGEYLVSCGFQRNVSNIPPIRFEKPIFSTFSASYSVYTAPAILCLIQFFVPLLFTCSAIIQDKLRGITERNLVAGVTVFEVTLSTIIVQCGLLVIQTLVIEYIQYIFYAHPFYGNGWLVFILLYLQGFSGTMLGIFICFVTKQEQLTGFGIMACSIPIMTLSGLMWPVEAQPQYLRFFSQLLPITYAIEALRCITIKGYSLAHPMVYMGFISTVLWSIGLSVWSYIQVRLNNGAP